MDGIGLGAALLHGTASVVHKGFIDILVSRLLRDNEIYFRGERTKAGVKQSLTAHLERRESSYLDFKLAV